MLAIPGNRTPAWMFTEVLQVEMHRLIGSQDGYDPSVILLFMSSAQTASPHPALRAQRLGLAAGIAVIVMGVALIVAVPALRHCVHLRGALEGRGERAAIGEIAAADAHTLVGEIRGLLGVADADGDLISRGSSQHLLHDGAAQLTGGSGDDDHAFPPYRVAPGPRGY